MYLLGIYGGFKITTCGSGLPFSLPRPVTVPENLLRSSSPLLSHSLVLVFTGKTRLAKTLVQDVIKRWYTREPDIGT